MKLFQSVIVTLSLLLCYATSGQVVINEICSSNGDVLEDQGGSTPDWLELYNYSTSDVDLTGWYLSDDPDMPTKWIFPNTSVPAQGYRIVFCSGESQVFDEPHTDFKLSKNGEFIVLSGSDSTIMDSVTFGFIPTDRSFGRQMDGEFPYVHYNTPTPRASNNDIVGTPSYRTATPQFSPDKGFYTDEVTVSISTTTANSTVFYTLDGSEPDTGSTIYTTPITSDSTIVIRSLAISQDLFPSEIGYSTYFINDISDIPVVSLITEPDYLFNPDTGIYMLGPDADAEFPYYGANFWADAEIPVFVEFFEEDGQLAFDQTLGLQIHGGTISRTRAMRSFRLLARSSYGQKRIKHRLFQSKTIDSFKRFLLRNSGSDFLGLGYRDGFIHEHIIGQGLHVDAGAYRPARVHINGDYWGIYNLREKYDRYYLEDNHGVDDKNLDLLEEQEGIVEGDFETFNSMENFILNNDLTTIANYKVAKSYFDIENLSDYYACQTFVNNSDWPYNNLKYWREKKTGAKWRYIIFDLDVALGGVSFNPVDHDNLGRILGSYGNDNRHVQIFKSFLTNQEFKQYFINRYNDLLNTTLSPSSLLESFEQTAETFETEADRHFDRWNGSWQHYEEVFETTVFHLTERAQFARDQLRNAFNIGPERTLSFGVFPEGAGTIELNTLTLSAFPWSGKYHSGNEISMTAIPNNGNEFSHWELKGVQVSDETTRTLHLDPADNADLVAVFDATFLGMDLSLHPDPASTELTLSMVVPNSGTCTISITNVNGQEVQQLYSEQTLPGRFTRQFDLNVQTQGVYLLFVKGQDYSASKRLVILPK